MPLSSKEGWRMKAAYMPPIQHLCHHCSVIAARMILFVQATRYLQNLDRLQRSGRLILADSEPLHPSTS
jgi:hypothetical protein